MWEFINSADFGKNVTEVVGTEDCRIFKLCDDTGYGVMKIYQVFPGAFLMYNDFHIKGCSEGIRVKRNLLCIDHCLEGCIEQKINNGTYRYLKTGDLCIDTRKNHEGESIFPLNHYHGISIIFQLDIAQKALPFEMKDFPVNLYELQKKYCENQKTFIISQNIAIKHIFSELYNVPSKIKKNYFCIKMLELLLYLDALEISENKEELPYFYKAQIEKIKATHKLLTEDLSVHYTIYELSQKFDIALTPLKNCFKAVYGSPIFSYMKMYRMNYAASLLKTDTNMNVAEIAGFVGYDSPSKFSFAFRKAMGKSPLEYRKSFV